MAQDLPPTGGYEPVQYKVSLQPISIAKSNTVNMLTHFPIPSATSPPAVSALPITSSPWASSAPTASTEPARESESKSTSPSPFPLRPFHQLSRAQSNGRSVSLVCENSSMRLDEIELGYNASVGFI